MSYIGPGSPTAMGGGFMSPTGNNIQNMYIQINTRYNKKSAKKAEKNMMFDFRKLMDMLKHETRRKFAYGVHDVFAGISSMIMKAFTLPIEVATKAFQTFGNVVSSSIGLAKQRMLTVARINTLTKGMGEEKMRDLEGYVLGENKNQQNFTSHQMSQVTRWASTLLASGMEWNKSKEWISRLNDIFGADTDALSRMVFNVGQIKASDRAYGLDIRQFGTAGFPIKDYLAKYLGIPISEVADAVSKGMVDYKAIEKAIFSATNRGGRYEGGTQNTLMTTPGRMNQLKARMEIYQADIGTPILESLLGVVTFANETLKELRPSFAELGESLADFVLRMTRAVKFVVGGKSGKEAMTFMSNTIKSFANTVELLIYDLFGIPKELADAGLTKENIDLSLNKSFQSYSKMMIDYIMFFIEKIEAPLLGVMVKIGIALGKGIWKGFKESLLGPEEGQNMQEPDDFEKDYNEVISKNPALANLIKPPGTPMITMSNGMTPFEYFIYKTKAAFESAYKNEEYMDLIDKTNKQFNDPLRAAGFEPYEPIVSGKNFSSNNSFTIYTDDTRDTVKTELMSARLEFQTMEAVV